MKEDIKIDNFKNRVSLIWLTTKTIFSTTILTLLLLINIVLSCTGKILLFLSTVFLLIPVYILLSLITSFVLVCLSIGLMPLEIIVFLIFGNTAIFSLPYKLISRIWDVDKYPIRLRDELFMLLDRSWLFIDFD